MLKFKEGSINIYGPKVGLILQRGTGCIIFIVRSKHGYHGRTEKIKKGVRDGGGANIEKNQLFMLSP